MYKEGYKEAYRGTATAGVNIDSSGNIIGNTGNTPNGYKTLTFNMVNADNNLSQNEEFVEIFVSQIMGATMLKNTQKLRVNWEV